MCRVRNSRAADDWGKVMSDSGLRAKLKALRCQVDKLSQQNEQLTAARQSAEGRSQCYEQLCESAPDGYLLTDAAGIIEQANRAASAMLLVEKKRLVGRSMVDFVVDEDRPGFGRRLLRIATTRSAPAWQVRLQPPEGQAFAVAVTVSAMGDGSGRPAGLRWLIRQLSKGEHGEEADAVTEKLRDSRVESEALLRAARAVLEHREFVPAAESIFEACKNLIGAAAGYVALLSPDGLENEVVHLDSGGLACTVDLELPMPIRGLRAEAYRSGKVVYDNDFANSQWMKFMPAGHSPLANVLFAPLSIGGKVVGLLGLGNKRGSFTDDDARVASAFGEIAAVALQNSRILESLEAGEQRLRSVVETAADAIISIDESGRIVFWNRAAEAMFGYRTDQMIGKQLSAIMPERLRQAHEHGLQRLLATGRQRVIGKTLELVGRHKGGNEFPIELTVAAWQAGEEHFFTGIIRDIAERKRTDENLRQSETKFRTLFETMTEGVALHELVYDESGAPIDYVIVDVNPAYERHTGLTPEHVIGKRASELYGTGQPPHFDIFKRVASSGESTRFETYFEPMRRHFAVSVLSASEGQFATVFEDITDRKRAEDEIRGLAKFPSENPNPVLRVAQDGTVLYANNAAQALLKTWSCQVGQGLPADWRQVVQAVLSSGLSKDIETTYQDHVISLTFAPVSDAGYVNVYGFDITDRKRTEESLRVSHQFLAIANRHEEMVPLLNDFMAEVKRYTGCSAVGIRLLDEQGNIPYQVYTGFSRSFFASESPLSIHSDQCMCISVITQTTDATLPFSTQGGSFYMNGTSRFLATLSEADKRRTRNVCNEYGFESVALVPIPLQGRVLGLIHVADARENMVPLEKVQMLERAALQVGAAIQRAWAEQELKKAHDQLETRVIERTAALTEANEQLKREIAERRRIEEALRQSQEQYRTLIQTMSEGLAVQDEHGLLTYVNDRFCELVGYSREELIGQSPIMFMDQDNRAIFKEQMATRPEGVYRQYEITLTTRGGQETFAFVSPRSLFDATGRYIGSIAVVTDISARVAAANQARQRQAELAHVARLGTMGEMASGLAHELNQPLSAIVNYIEACLARIRAGTEDPKILLDDLAAAAGQAERAGEIIDHIRNFTRRSAPRRSTLDINLLVREAVDMMKSEIQHNAVQVRMELADDLPLVVGEAIQIQQVMVNLIRNGVEAMTDNEFGGRQMTVRTYIDADGLVECAIADTGPGLPDDAAEQVFEQFFTTKAEGMGMGLSISRTIMEAHRGRLWATPNPERGTTFRFTLPTSEGDRPDEN